MRKLGLIGGMSWVSTESYYRRINSEVQRKLGGFASAHLLIESVNSMTMRACSRMMIGMRRQD